ncbi:type III glutamate--ammonia ligase [Zavarzinia sp. CC-PAN008]|uniref:type III glutamate--ammonia ligase n=1 Tax=Zavarzinia sp. CC-PAN008 TaxID=3243332 RepID=UPI003F7441D5
MGADLDAKALKARLAEQGVKFAVPSYVDMHGVPKGKIVPISHFEKMAKGSELYTGAALDGVPQDISDDEVGSVPDLASGFVLPWDPSIAWFASDLAIQGTPFEACSRNILNRVMASYAELGYQPQLGIEAEFYVLKDAPGGGYAPVSDRPHLDKAAYDAVRLLDNMGWMGELVDAMNALGWGVYSFDHEDGIGQFEVDFNYFDARTMADRYVFLRMMVHEIARRHGHFSSFMPKPFQDRAGSGAHYNMSLKSLETGANLFQAGDEDPRKLKLGTLGYHFIAGVLRHLPAICAVIAPTVNSYKRLTLEGSASGTTWAPVFVCYGDNNRTNSLRVPDGGGRVELRVPDSACNPYLGAAMVFAAGLEGIREKADPGEPHHENMYFKTPAQLAALNVRKLPSSLGSALDAFEADPLSRAVFGDAMFDSWLSYKLAEWSAFSSHVTDWEKGRYLKMF